MRINLVTPFAEKDAVKALGARWDPAKKVWYIIDVADVTPFARWIPDLQSATDDSAGTAAHRSSPQSAITTPRPQSRLPARKPPPPLDVPHCGCKVLPWEACEHSARP
ncbi:MAG: DUF5710 domain-containing protein [Burkholderiaceae bacterium]